MDDLNLLSKLKTKLQTSFNITTEFFLLNDIKANPLKIKLFVINTKKNKGNTNVRHNNKNSTTLNTN